MSQKFQASVAEVDDQELWGNATIGAAVVSGSASQALAVLQAIEEENQLIVATRSPSVIGMVPKDRVVNLG